MRSSTGSCCRVDETLPEWKPFFEALAAEKRAAEIVLPDASRTDGTHRRAWISAERLPAALAIFPDVSPIPPITALRPFVTIGRRSTHAWRWCGA